MTLTRDRVEYTKHCFASLHRNAGCEYDHYVLDQNSQDGTQEWLYQQSLEGGKITNICLATANIGCCAGWNSLLDSFDLAFKYDVVVCFDNDCEVLQEQTLEVIAGLVYRHKMILAPRVDGLMHPPPAIGHFHLDGYEIEETSILGNIFMAIPAELLVDFRWDEAHYQVWDGGESIVPWYRAHGGHAGYVPEFRVNHYLTTLGQKEDMPWYAERRIAEGGRVA